MNIENITVKKACREMFLKCRNLSKVNDYKNKMTPPNPQPTPSHPFKRNE